MIQAFEDKVAGVQKTSDTPMHFAKAMKSGFEGREAELGLAMSVVFKTLQNVTPYRHEINDALVKAWLTSIQFIIWGPIVCLNNLLSKPPTWWFIATAMMKLSSWKSIQ